MLKLKTLFSLKICHLGLIKSELTKLKHYENKSAV